MIPELPLYSQQKENTCALACLRMALAAFGTDVEENVLERETHLEPDGTEIGELERLARQYGLVANIQEASIECLGQVVTEGKVALAYIDRAVFDLTPTQRARHSLRMAKIHVVVPVRVTATSVVYHDPLPPARIVRRSIRRFGDAYNRLGNHCVVCSKPRE